MSAGISKPDDLVKAVVHAHGKEPEVRLALPASPPRRAPLAVSARCCHARTHRRTEDHWQVIRDAETDSVPPRTRDERPILRVDGIKAQTKVCPDLLPETDCLVSSVAPRLGLIPENSATASKLNYYN